MSKMGKMVILKLLQPFIEPKSNLFYRKSGQHGLNYTDFTIGPMKNPKMSQKYMPKIKIVNHSLIKPSFDSFLSI